MLNRLPWKKNVRTPTFNFPCRPPAKHPLIQQNVTLKKYWYKACVPKDIGFIFWRWFFEIILLPKNLCTVHITFYLNVTNLPYLVKIPLNSFWERKLSRRCIILPGSNRKGTFLCAPLQYLCRSKWKFYLSVRNHVSSGRVTFGCFWLIILRTMTIL